MRLVDQHGEQRLAPVTRDQTVLCRRDRQGDRKYKSSSWAQTKTTRLSKTSTTVKSFRSVASSSAAPAWETIARLHALVAPILPIMRQRLSGLKQLSSRIARSL